MTVLVIIESVQDTRNFIRLSKSIRASPTHSLLVVATDPKVQQLLKNKQIAFQTEQDFPFSDRYQDVTQHAYMLASYFCSSAFPRTANLDWQGIWIPELLYWESAYYFLWVLRSIAFIKELIDHIRPQALWASFYQPKPIDSFLGGREQTFYGDIALHLARERTIPTILLNDGSTRFQQRMSTACYKAFQNIATPRMRQRLNNASKLSLWALFVDFLKDSLTYIAEKIYYSVLYSHINSTQFHQPNLTISSDYNRIRLLLHRLKELGHFRLIFLRDRFSLKQSIAFLRKGILFLTPHMFLPDINKRQISSYRKCLQKYWKTSSSEILKNPTYNFKNYHFGHLLEEKYQFLLTEAFPQCAVKIEQLKRFLKRTKNNRIVVDEDVCSFNKTLVMVAKTEGIQSLVVQHGFTGLPIGFVPLSATFFAAWGEFTKRRLSSWGVEKERVVVTGNMLHDKLDRQACTNRETVFRHLKLNLKKKTFLLAMFPYRNYALSDFPEAESFAYQYDTIIRIVSEAVNDLKESQLIIKLHPRDSQFKRGQELIQSINHDNIIILRQFPSLDYIQHVDCLVSAWISTLIIDTLPFKRPIVVIDPTADQNKTRAILDLNVPVVPIDKIVVTRELQKVLLNQIPPIDDEVIFQHLYKRDGQTMSRIVEAIQNLNRHNALQMA